MKNVDRFRRPEQLLLFQPQRVLPSWKNLPASVRQSVSRLLAKMLRDHRARVDSVQETGETTNE